MVELETVRLGGTELRSKSLGLGAAWFDRVWSETPSARFIPQLNLELTTLILIRERVRSVGGERLLAASERRSIYNRR